MEELKPGESSRALLTLSVVGGLVWASFAPFTLLFGVYLRSQGLSYASIGLLMTITSLFSSLLQPVFGAVADKYRNRKTIVSISLLIRSLAYLILLLSADVISMSVWYVVAGLFLAGFMPLAQSMVADLSEDNRLGISMGRYRLFGSMGWAAACILTGLLARVRLWNIFPVALAFSTLSFLVSLFLPRVEGRRKSRYENIQERGGSSVKLAACFTASILISGMGIGATSSFLTISLSQLGSDPLFIGVVIAVGALLEVPAMYLGGWLSDRVGGLPVLVLGEVGLAMVYWLYGTVKNIYSYLLIQSIRGILYALFTVSGMSISSSLGGSRRGGLYAGFYNLSLQLGTASGPYFGGLVSDYQGLWAMFALSSALSMVSAMLLAPWIIGPLKKGVRQSVANQNKS
ncbi:MAG: MFS transporter [Candidatus Brockarchaeota archaeon]|nr:MFS transporter [Candidatus Brockarchaeota archaeon]MBO3808630.1 MFS transporter [Candidatus Brockarchaeota archaeon]